MKDKFNIAVIGASGYSGEELLRLLFAHPNVDVKLVTSRQYAGQLLSTVYPRFTENDMLFLEPNVNDITKDIDFCFLALPHGLASEYAIPLVKKGIRVIDISADFRLEDDEAYQQYYGQESPRKLLNIKPVYGAPERYRKEIINAQLVACPGCYPTSCILPLFPLLKTGAISTNNIVINAMSGVTGAGRNLKAPFMYAECNESSRPYGVTGHRHLPEIEQELKAALTNNKNVSVNFIPHLIPQNRGIHSTIVVPLAQQGLDEKQLHKILEDYYKEEPFVRILPLGKLADTKDVSWTNFCEIGLRYDEKTNNVILSSAIDNLTKGASGQAVQCFNIMAKLIETKGL